MKRILALLAVSCALAAAEDLHYTINWQSGLSLGEGALITNKAASGNWSFELTLDAAVPGYTVRDEYRSSADTSFCAVVLDKLTVRGSRRSTEKETFNQSQRTLRRETEGGGGSQVSTGECARDALTFLQFLRQELAQGRIAPNQSVYLGSKYDLQLTYVGTETIRQGDQRVEADKVRTSIHGPKSDLTIELYFARDEVRTPVLARLPLALGVFTVELLP